MHDKAGQYPSHKARQQFDSDGAVWTPMPRYPVTTHAHFMWLAARLPSKPGCASRGGRALAWGPLRGLVARGPPVYLWQSSCRL